jgi:hypothetical protein
VNELAVITVYLIVGAGVGYALIAAGRELLNGFRIAKTEFAAASQSASSSKFDASQGKEHTVAPREGAAMSVDANWYVYVNGKTFGPIGFDDLAKLSSRGELRKSDLVWTKRYNSWVPAESVDALFPPPPSKSDGQFLPVIPPVTEDCRLSASTGKCADGTVEPGTISRSKSRNYFLRHWRGELALPVSYWINGFLGNVIAIAAIAIINANTNLKDDFAPTLALLSIILTWATLCLISVWQVVGTWRSANNYKQANATKYWGGIAQFILVLAVLRTIGEFFATGVPQIAEMYSIIAGDEQTGKHAFRILRNGRELEFAGGVTFGTAKEFEQFLEAMGTLKIVHLNSQGGRVLEAQRIAELIRTRNLITYVSNQCLSACTIMFLGGRERYIADSGRLGFHQPDFPGLKDEDRRAIIAEEETRLRRLGVSDAFARRALQAKPDNMWFPALTELLDAGVVTRIVQSSDFALSGISAAAITPDEIQKILLSDETYVAIKRINPKAYTEISAELENGLRRGSSVTELREQISPIVTSVFLEALPYASDQYLFEFARFAVKASALLNMESPAACYFYFNPDKTSSKAILDIRARFKDISEEEKALTAKMLRSFERVNIRRPSEHEVASSLERIYAALAAKFGDQLALLSEEVPPNKYSTYCLILTNLYDQALNLPPKDSSAFLRFMLLSQESDPKKLNAAQGHRASANQ